MARPNWEYIRVDVRLPRHKKLEGLTAAARTAVIGTLTELWCHCGEEHTDGFVRDAVWNRAGTAGARKVIADPARELAERGDGGWWMHDYTDWNRSAGEVHAVSARRAESGRRGGLAKAKAVASAKQVPDDLLPLATASKRSKKVAEAEAEAEAEPPVAEVINGQVEGMPPRRIELPAKKWMDDEDKEPLPPERLKEEAERRRQMDALMRDYPEVSA